jgi:hypothetical protein
MIAKNEMGQVLRQKLKITLSYQAGANPISALFKNIQVTLDLPKTGVYSEQKDFKFDLLSFQGGSTPTIISVFLYPTKHDEPIESKVRVNLSYTQIRDPA